MRRLIKLSAALAMACALALSCKTNDNTQDGPRVVQDFNFDWKFNLGEDVSCEALAAPGFDDASWRSLHLPHDWAIEGEFSQDNPAGTGGGALPGGIGWYRKHFATPAGERIYVEFDGVFMNSTVYVNGKEAGHRPYGYSSFSYDITDMLNAEGEDNVIAVRCDNAEQPNSRWYSGCGIYRNVRLLSVNNRHIAYSGTYITTPEIKDDYTRIDIQATVENCAEQVDAVISHVVKDASGKVVGEISDDMPLATGENVDVVSLTIGKPHLWSTKDPYLYKVETTVKIADAVVDNYETVIGIRYTSWDPEKGFFLNGEPLKMLGVCLHHDMGCIGSAVHRRALERELGILKDMGCNAIRTSHNPPAPELLKLADEMGFVVIDEAFDMWRKPKTTYDYSLYFDEWHERDIEGFIKRDRNHPSVVMWSIGNELGEQGDSKEDNPENLTPEKANILLNFIGSLQDNDPSETNPNRLLTKHVAKLVRDLDPTRFVTAGCNGVNPGNNMFASGALDAFGYNYGPRTYDMAHEWFKGTPMYGSETVSSLNSRGVYFQPSTNKEKQPKAWWLTYETDHHQCTAYDAMCAPWANYHEEAWTAIRDREFMAGTFVWTGFDYLGEPTPYGWPSRSSYFGIVDLAGFPKDCYWMYQSEWQNEEDVLHLFPHWNWTEGEEIDIWAYYNNADEVELFVNGESLGRQSKTNDVLHAQWLSVPFKAGKIEAVSYKDGKVVARDSHETTGEPVSIKLTADRNVISADGYDLSYVTVEAVDSKGRAVPVADNMMHFEVSGAGELFGVDNGNACDLLCLKGQDKALFSGKALAVIRSVKGEKGVATLSVTSDGLKSAELKIKTK